MPPDSYPFPMYSGLLEPRHYKKIGSALWLFLWCISSTTKDIERDGLTWGIVLGNKPVNVDEIAERFGVEEKTVRRWIKTLEQHEYIRVTRAPNGLILTVRNSKKFGQSDTDKNVRSLNGDRTKMSDQSGSDRTKMSDPPDKNVRSNKDIIKILIDRLIDGLDDDRLIQRCGVLTTVLAGPVEEIHLDEQSIAHRIYQIETYFNDRRARLASAGTDWVPLNEVAKSKIPIEFILFGIDLAFARHEKAKRWPSDEIQNFSYCRKVIIGTWQRLQTELKESVEAGEISTEIGARPVKNKGYRGRKEDQIERAMQELREAKERDRNRGSGIIHSDNEHL